MLAEVRGRIKGSTKTWNPESGNGNGIMETESRKRKRKQNTESVKEGSKRSISRKKKC